MITILMTGMCEGCAYADLELDNIEDMMGRKTWTATCIHRGACDWMETRTINRVMNPEQEPDTIRFTTSEGGVIKIHEMPGLHSGGKLHD